MSLSVRGGRHRPLILITCGCHHFFQTPLPASMGKLAQLSKDRTSVRLAGANLVLSARVSLFWRVAYFDNRLSTLCSLIPRLEHLSVVGLQISPHVQVLTRPILFTSENGEIRFKEARRHRAPKLCLWQPGGASRNPHSSCTACLGLKDARKAVYGPGMCPHCTVFTPKCVWPVEARSQPPLHLALPGSRRGETLPSRLRW